MLLIEDESGAASELGELASRRRHAFAQTMSKDKAATVITLSGVPIRS